jgi:hypothetical protein
VSDTIWAQVDALTWDEKAELVDRIEVSLPDLPMDHPLRFSEAMLRAELEAGRRQAREHPETLKSGDQTVDGVKGHLGL